MKAIDNGIPFDAIVYVAFNSQRHRNRVKIGCSTKSGKARFGQFEPAFEEIWQIDLADIKGYRSLYLERYSMYVQGKNTTYARGRLEEAVEEQMKFLMNRYMSRAEYLEGTSGEWYSLGVDYAIAKANCHGFADKVELMLPDMFQKMLGGIDVSQDEIRHELAESGGFSQTA